MFIAHYILDCPPDYTLFLTFNSIRIARDFMQEQAAIPAYAHSVALA